MFKKSKMRAILNMLLFGFVSFVFLNIVVILSGLSIGWFMHNSKIIIGFSPLEYCLIGLELLLVFALCSIFTVFIFKLFYKLTEIGIRKYNNMTNENSK